MLQTAVFGEAEAEGARARSDAGDETALSGSHRPHRCSVTNCAKVQTNFETTFCARHENDAKWGLGVHGLSLKPNITLIILQKPIILV